MSPSHKLVVVAGVAIVALVGISYAKRRATNPGARLLDPINPLSRENLAYRGVNAVVATFTDDSEATLGTWLYEKLNPSRVEEERRLFSSPAAQPAPDTSAWDRLLAGEYGVVAP